MHAYTRSEIVSEIILASKPLRGMIQSETAQPLRAPGEAVVEIT